MSELRILQAGLCSVWGVPGEHLAEGSCCLGKAVLGLPCLLVIGRSFQKEGKQLPTGMLWCLLLYRLLDILAGWEAVPLLPAVLFASVHGPSPWKRMFPCVP